MNNKKNILIIADMEGIIDIYDLTNIEKNRELMCKEIGLIFNELIQIDSYNIYYCDCHNDGSTTSSLKELFIGIHFINSIWDIDFKIKYDKAFLVGFHAMNGSAGILSHSFRPEISKIELNETPVGELGIYINILSYYNIPTAYISGDNKAIDEIKYVDCIKNIVKNNNDKDIEVDKIYKDMISKIRLAVNYEISHLSFNNGIITLKFINDHLLRLFSNENYLIDNDKLVFENTIDFFNQLKPLCRILNKQLEKNYYSTKKFIKRLRDKYKTLDPKNITDKRVNELLNRNPYNLTCIELNEIADKLEKIYKQSI